MPRLQYTTYPGHEAMSKLPCSSSVGLMSITDILINSKFTRIAIKSGNYFFIFTIFLTGASHFGVINLSLIPIPNLDSILWGYIILSSLIATPFIYLERKTRVSVDRRCPLCKGHLEIFPKYYCPECDRSYEKEL